jgi:hypothetical protein
VILAASNAMDILRLDCGLARSIAMAFIGSMPKIFESNPNCRPEMFCANHWDQASVSEHPQRGGRDGRNMKSTFIMYFAGS